MVIIISAGRGKQKQNKTKQNGPLTSIIKSRIQMHTLFSFIHLYVVIKKDAFRSHLVYQLGNSAFNPN